MIYRNVEFSNCAEIKSIDGYVTPQRIPESVRLKLNPTAQLRMLQPACGEIRFYLPPGNTARLTVSSESESRIMVYFGDHCHSDLIFVRSEPQVIEIHWSERLLKGLSALCNLPHAFDPRVVRVLVCGSAIRIHDIDGTEIRPPHPDEIPSLRYMAYGTSITHEASAIAPHLPYVWRTARLLGADLLNFGMGGSCHCEPELADYLASRSDWHIGTLALSVNMLGFEHAEFEKRVRYMVHTVAASNPSRPVACITIAPYYGDLYDNGAHSRAKVSDFRQVLRDAVVDCPTKNAHLIEGEDLLSSYVGLTTDLIHPSDDGMIEMSMNLAHRLKALLC